MLLLGLHFGESKDTSRPQNHMAVLMKDHTLRYQGWHQEMDSEMRKPLPTIASPLWPSDSCVSTYFSIATDSCCTPHSTAAPVKCLPSIVRRTRLSGGVFDFRRSTSPNIDAVGNLGQS